MPGPTFTVLESIEHQATACRRIGSPLYGSLLDGLALDYLSGGVTAELLTNVSSRPVHDAVPLRYLATAHHLALAGVAPLLAENYASCGGQWDGSDITDVFLSVVATHRHDFIEGLQRNVQTNEVGRSAVLAAGASFVTERFGLPLSTLEIGASAGLLSRFPYFGYDTGESRCGDPDSPVQFDSSWFEGSLPPLHPLVGIATQAASDITPIDLSSKAGRLTMQSFLWPDQDERRVRLVAALDVAERHPLRVQQADAGEWLDEQLGQGLPDNVATVVFHSIVWQYLPAATRTRVISALTRAGAEATNTSPLCWLRMEPANAEHAELRCTTWPNRHEVVLAHVGYHGTDVRWL